ncbi:hypothetical protein F5883DRAFT_701774 [Diaporthe sp. PMI_573]|nr:hypothetical protein F5883DRAFT_701774 [Diaporthaceae sp. PMI_573]
MTPNHTPSPGNDFSSGEPPMRQPHLEFIYRIVADMDPGASPIPNVQGTAVTRIVLPIAGGTVRGPQINGEIVKNSGADWAQRIESPKSPTKLNARYTLKTDDGHFILVNAVGTVTGGPPVEGADAAWPPEQGKPLTITQDQAEYFTQITFEAAGGSPYEWMNSVVALGVMIMAEGKPIIDCYRLTNFPGTGTAHL